MKRHPFFRVSVAALLAIPGLLVAQQGAVESASQNGTVEVIEAAICTDVLEREPQEVSETMSASLENVFCWTKIKNEGEPTTITHVWYFNGTKMAEVNLNVGTSPGWRTWSSKQLWKGWVGKWKVVIEDADGTPIKDISFTTTD